MSWTLCTSGAAIIKAGVHVNSDIVNYATNKTAIDQFSTDAEGRIELYTGMSFVANIGSAPGALSGAISEICSSMIAQALISYDDTGYLAREADMLMNYNEDIIVKGLNKLDDFKNTTLNNPF